MSRSLLIALGVLFVGACGSSPPAPIGDAATTPFDSDLAVATFDSAWSTIHRTHFDVDFAETRWVEARDEYRPRALAATDDAAFDAILREMIASIGLSHFGILRESTVEGFDDVDLGSGGRGDVGAEMRLVDGQVVVWRVVPDAPADRAGVQTGWIVARVGRRELAPLIEQAREQVGEAQLATLFAQRAPTWMRGPVGTSAKVTFVDGAGEERSLAIEREVLPGEWNKFGNLPSLRTDLEHRWAEHGDARIGVIAFNIWLVPVALPFDLAMDDFRDEADGIVIDLRGNLGGIGVMTRRVGGNFFDEPASLGVMKTRGTELEFRVNPRRSTSAGERIEPYAGPVAILVDGLSMSTSEIFARGMQSQGRARVFGQPTPGAALPSFITALPNGDALQHAVADFVDPEGLRLEKSGVVPDEIVPLERDDLLAGRDAPLDAALDWIAAEASNARR